MKLIDIQFITNPEEDDQAAGDAKGKAEYVDEGECLIPQQVAKSNEQVVFNHGR